MTLQSEITKRVTAAASALALPLSAADVEDLATALCPAVTAMLTDLQASPAPTPVSADVAAFAAAADSLRRQPDLVSLAVEPDGIHITVRPQSVMAWRWWLRRLQVQATSVRPLGDDAVACGRLKGVVVRLRGDGVLALDRVERSSNRLSAVLAGAAR
jgi:hypothetical protein